MDNFSGIFGIFDRVAQLHEDPLLADIYKDMEDMDNFQYIGPEADRENLRNDMRNWATDFGKAVSAAKQKLGGLVCQSRCKDKHEAMGIVRNSG